jgi:hypothetical protein
MGIIKTFENFQQYTEPKVVKWESLKNKVINSLTDELQPRDFVLKDGANLLLYFLNRRINGEKELDYEAKRNLYKEIRDDLIGVVNSWDIRNVNQLIEMYPKGVPTFIKNGNYTTELTDDGWSFVETF